MRQDQQMRVGTESLSEALHQILVPQGRASGTRHHRHDLPDRSTGVGKDAGRPRGPRTVGACPALRIPGGWIGRPRRNYKEFRTVIRRLETLFAPST